MQCAQVGWYDQGQLDHLLPLHLPNAGTALLCRGFHCHVSHSVGRLECCPSVALLCFGDVIVVSLCCSWLLASSRTTGFLTQKAAPFVFIVFIEVSVGDTIFSIAVVVIIAVTSPLSWFFVSICWSSTRHNRSRSFWLRYHRGSSCQDRYHVCCLFLVLDVLVTVLLLHWRQTVQLLPSLVPLCCPSGQRCARCHAVFQDDQCWSFGGYVLTASEASWVEGRWNLSEYCWLDWWLYLSRAPLPPELPLAWPVRRGKSLPATLRWHVIVPCWYSVSSGVAVSPGRAVMCSPIAPRLTMSVPWELQPFFTPEVAAVPVQTWSSGSS